MLVLLKVIVGVNTGPHPFLSIFVAVNIVPILL